MFYSLLSTIINKNTCSACFQTSKSKSVLEFKLIMKDNRFVFSSFLQLPFPGGVVNLTMWLHSVCRVKSNCNITVPVASAFQRCNILVVLQKLMTNAGLLCGSLQVFLLKWSLLWIVEMFVLIKSFSYKFWWKLSCYVVYASLKVDEFWAGLYFLLFLCRYWNKGQTRTSLLNPFFHWVVWTISPWWWRCTLPILAASWGPSMLCWSWMVPCPVTGDITSPSW